MCSMCVKSQEKDIVSRGKSEGFYYVVFLKNSYFKFLHKKILKENTFFTHIVYGFSHQLFSVFTHNTHQLLSPLSLNK